jgi:hypothetical protein
MLAAGAGGAPPSPDHIRHDHTSALESLPPQPGAEIVEGEVHYRVEAFRDRRLEYLVKWCGYPEEENTWNAASQVAQDMDGATINRLVEQYRQRAGSSVNCATKP